MTTIAPDDQHGVRDAADDRSPAVGSLVPRGDRLPARRGDGAGGGQSCVCHSATSLLPPVSRFTRKTIAGEQRA